MTEKPSRNKLAAEKLELARQLFTDGDTPKTTLAAINKKFGGGISSTVLYELHREITGKSLRRKKRAKRVKRKSAKRKSTGLVPIQIPPEVGPSLPISSLPSSMQGIARTLVDMMRHEGIEGISLRADGRGQIFHLTSQDIKVGEV